MPRAPSPRGPAARCAAPGEVRRPRQPLCRSIRRRKAAVRHHRAEHGAVLQAPHRWPARPVQALSRHVQDAGLPSHRDFRFSEKIEANIKANATSAELVDGGNAVRNAFGASPFPIPGRRLRADGNHALQARANSEEAIYDQAVIYSNGNQALQTVHYQILAFGARRPAAAAMTAA